MSESVDVESDGLDEVLDDIENEEEGEEEEGEEEEEFSLEEKLGLNDLNEEESSEVTEEDLEGEDDEEEEEEEEEEEPSILDEASEEDIGDEEDGVLPDDFDELSREEQDAEIFLAMEDDQSWKDWRATGEEVHEEVDRSFAVELLKAGYDPAYLSERGIYSLADFKERLDVEEGKSGEKAIVLSDPDNVEELAHFKEEYFGIPKEKDGYSTEGLKDTIYEGDVEATDILLERAHRCSWTQGQMIEQATHNTLVGEELERREREELNDYRKGQKDGLKKLYGQNAAPISKDVVGVLRRTQAGREFLSEFKDSKAVASSNFYAMVHNLISRRISSTELNSLVNVGGDEKRLDAVDVSGHSVEELIKTRDKVMGSRVANKQGQSRAEIEKHERAWRIIGRLNDEIERREAEEN